MFEIEIYDKRDPQAIRVSFNGKSIFILNEYGRLEKVGWIDYNGEMRNIEVLYNPFAVSPKGRGDIS